MKKTREFDNILNECLERVLIKGETIERCLASYPEQAAELEPLLKTALVTKKASAIKPRPEFRERARYQFRSALQEMEPERGRWFFGWQPQWATVVIAVLVLLLASGGTVAAAGNSMPDEPLYQLKLATETVRLALTPSALGKAELYVHLADKRVTEIAYMADKGKPEQIERTARRLNTHLIAMASLAAPRGRELPEKEATPFMAPAPRAAPKEAPAPPVEKEDREKETGVMMAPAPGAAQKAPAPPGQVRGGKGDGDDEGIKVDKRAKLRVILAHRAVEHPKALRAVLKRAPASVKPALRRAIALSDTGYEQALRSLD